MAGRITNSMITENAAYNIQLNKRYQDQLSKQQATGRKVYDPSDDPVTAIRDLKYKNNLSDITQYLERNLEEAKNWSDITFTALDKARDVMNELQGNYKNGINDTNTLANRQIYLDSQRALEKEYYKIGNSTSEDRYLFTGYRTGDSLTFTDQNMNVRAIENGTDNPKYDYLITETFDKDSIDSYRYLSKKVTNTDIGLASGDLTTGTKTVEDETQIDNVSCYRIRLAYDQIKNIGSKTVQGQDPNDPNNTIDTTVEDREVKYKDIAGNDVTKQMGVLSYTDSSSNPQTKTVVYVDDDTKIDLSTGDVYLNYETGMLIFDETVKAELYTATDISFDYQKSKWNVGDLKPEHYFDCVDIAPQEGKSKGQILEYNEHEQKITYTVGDNQKISVNTNASEAFDPQVKRQNDELEDAINAMNDATTKLEEIDAKINSGNYSGDTLEQLKYLRNAANKEKECSLANLNSIIDEGMKKMSAVHDKVNLAATDCGTIQNRVELISSRLTANKGTVEEQASNNINIDLSKVIIDLKEASTTYSGSLGVIGKITQQTLLNFI